MFSLEAFNSRTRATRVEPTIEGLRHLQQAQMGSIPFENIEPYLGVVPSLKDCDIWTKLILQERGGYCFELNWLFGEALKANGFEIRPLLGRVRMGMPVGGIRGHFAWIVSTVGKDWIADAGFGGPGPFGPIEVREGEQVIEGDTFRFVLDAKTGERVLERRKGQEWFALFGYDETRFTDADVSAANFLCATSPSEPFVNNLMMSSRNADRQATLMNRGIKFSSAANTFAREVNSLDDLTRFVGIELSLKYNENTLSQAWAKLKGVANSETT